MRLTSCPHVCLGVVYLIVGMISGLILSGFATFGPKFVQNQFSVSASHASMIVGKRYCAYWCAVPL